MSQYAAEMIREIELYLENRARLMEHDLSAFREAYNANVREVEEAIRAAVPRGQQELAVLRTEEQRLKVREQELTDAVEEQEQLIQKLQDTQEEYAEENHAHEEYYSLYGTIIAEADRILNEAEREAHARIFKLTGLPEMLMEAREVIMDAKELREDPEPAALVTPEFSAYINDKREPWLNRTASFHDRIARLRADLEPMREEHRIMEHNFPYGEDSLQELEEQIAAAQEELERRQEALQETEAAQRDILPRMREILTRYCDQFADDYQARLHALWEHPSCLAVAELCDKVDIRVESGYVLRKFPHLLHLLYLYPGSPRPMALSGKYSVPCQEAYEQLYLDFNTGYDDEPVYQELREEAHECYCAPGKSAEPDDGLLNEWIGLPRLLILSEEELQYREAINYCIRNGMVSVSLLQRQMKVNYAVAARLVERMEEDGIAGPFAESRPREVLTDQVISLVLPRAKEGVLRAAIPALDRLRQRRRELFAEPIYTAEILRPGFLNRIKALLEQDPEMDFPALIMELRAKELDASVRMTGMFQQFAELYRETPEEILKTNQVYYAERELEQQEEAARLERELLEEQAELDREAAYRNAQMIAQAEQERARAEMEQTRSMIRQAELDRAAADRRAANELAEANRRAERAERDIRHQQARERSEANEQARRRCNTCANAGKCRMMYSPGPCAAFRPR